MNQIAKKKASTPSTQFRALAVTCAKSLLTDWVGQERAGEAVGRVSAALACARASAKKPEEFDKCTPESVGSVIAIAALTGIMPSQGATSLAYAIPRSPRKGMKPNLTYQLSHRGLNALANRCGQHMIAIPVGYNDVISLDQNGSVVIDHIDFDDPPSEWDELRGVVLIVKRLEGSVVIFRGWVPKKILEVRREQSDAFRYGERKLNEDANNTWAKSPWHSFPIEMAMKTAMHYAASRGWAVLDDTECVRAMAADNSADLTVDAINVRTIDAGASNGGIAALENAIEEPGEVTVDVEPSEPSEPSLPAKPAKGKKKSEPEDEGKSKSYERWFRSIQTESDRSKGASIIDAMANDADLPIVEFKLLESMVKEWDN